MRKRILILCSLIGLLLVGFRSDIYAEEDSPDISSSTSIITSAALDQYFYDNYDLLPYIQSNGQQYINTGVNTTSELKIDFSFSDIVFYDNQTWYDFIYSFNSMNLRYGFILNHVAERTNFYFLNNIGNYNFNPIEYNIYNVSLDKNKCYINSSLIKTLEYNSFDLHRNLLFLAGNDNSNNLENYISCKLYKLSIYDYSANEGEGALVRDYYPARSKASGIIGLYDAVNKTFVTTSGSVPFDSPTGDATALSLGANITQFLSGSLSWIGAIFEGINEMPIIWVFIAIGLAGVMFRWGRRLVHF